MLRKESIQFFEKFMQLIQSVCKINYNQNYHIQIYAITLILLVVIKLIQIFMIIIVYKF